MRTGARKLRDEAGPGRPLWVHIANVLRSRIEKGGDVGGLSDVALAGEFKVSTVVVRQAVQQLVQEGLLVRRRGKGTFLANEPLHGGLEALECFVDEWRLQGHSVRVELLDRRLIAANMTVAADLVDGIPDDDFLQESIWRVLRRWKNADPGETRITIKAAAATAEVARSLGIEVGSPVLDHEVQVVSDHGQIMILGSSLYHPERFVYSTKVQKRRL
jgi:GntR family transcriptional regulator